MPKTAAAYIEIGAFDAKTRLSEILRKVDKGARFTITVRGRAVADVVPSQHRDQQRVKEAVEALRRFPRIKGVSGNEVLGWIREGRK